jgi:hypothetical protein
MLATTRDVLRNHNTHCHVTHASKMDQIKCTALEKVRLTCHLGTLGLLLPKPRTAYVKLSAIDIKNKLTDAAAIDGLKLERYPNAFANELVAEPWALFTDELQHRHCGIGTTLQKRIEHIIKPSNRPLPTARETIRSISENARKSMD